MIKSVFRKVATWQPDGIKKVHSGLFSSMLLVKFCNKISKMSNSTIVLIRLITIFSLGKRPWCKRLQL